MTVVYKPRHVPKRELFRFTWNQATLRSTVGLLSAEQLAEYQRAWHERNGDYERGKGTLRAAGVREEVA